MANVVEISSYDESKGHLIPVFLSKVQAGFPSPADDYVAQKLDINKYLVSHPTATFFVKVAGDSMKNAGILDNDMLVVDRSIDASHGKIDIAIINNEVTVKRLYNKQGKIELHAENELYLPVKINSYDELRIWGVVTAVVRKL